VVLFTTALGLYGGVLWLWSGELQGFIIHEMGPSLGSAGCWGFRRTPHAARRGTGRTAAQQ
jgi:hypothetical protein